MRHPTTLFLAVSTAIFAGILTGCPVWIAPEPTPDDGGRGGAGGGGGGAGGTASTSSRATTADGSGGSGAPDCLVSQCPEPEECGAAVCLDNACAVRFSLEGTSCGFAGTCDGDGHCDDAGPMPCPDTCPDAGECGHGYCDPYSGQCQIFHHDNNTTCDSLTGYCNSSTGTCCHGWQVLGLPGSCVEVCPPGTVPVWGQGVCL
mgnify:FL=1